MHGVSDPFVQRAFETFNIPPYVPVREQQKPDPEFPTVKFPNPEEKGALDLAMQTADAASIPLIVASDPDADRLAAAEKVSGRWHIFTGNQLGILIASYLYERYPADKPKGKLRLLYECNPFAFIAEVAGGKGDTPYIARDVVLMTSSS